MQMIAERDKRSCTVSLICGIALIVLGSSLLSVSGWYAFVVALGGVFAGFGLYYVCAPKTAIARKGDAFVFFFTFRSKEIPISEIEYVSFHEIGTFANRGGSLLGALHILKNDIRTLTVTIKKDGSLKHFYVVGVLDATAVAASIHSWINK